MAENNDILTSSVVAVSTGHVGYPSVPPYSPSIIHAEYPFSPDTLLKEVNHAYEGVRDALRLLGLDMEHHGRREWNPLGEILRPGDTVELLGYINHVQLEDVLARASVFLLPSRQENSPMAIAEASAAGIPVIA